MGITSMRILRSTSSLLYCRLIPIDGAGTQTASLSTKGKPYRPTERGEVTAYFPQTDKTVILKDGKEAVLSQWKDYLKKLSGSAVPERLGGPERFESRVRNRRASGQKELIPKERSSGKHERSDK